MTTSTRALASFLVTFVLAVPLVACGSDDGSGGGSTSGQGGQGQGGGQAGGATGGGGGSTDPCADPVNPNETLDATSDPEMGMFTMQQALEGLPPGPGPLRAIIDTDLGVVTCELRPDKAPIGVANFVGLARGIRPWLDPATNKWVKRRFYDGLLFHRVIADFMAQGGDPLGTGTGGPGYEFVNEPSDLTHVPGTLAYANAGPDTNGSQFYITDSAQHTLDGGYTIFGLCTPLTMIKTLTHVMTGLYDRPVTPLHMKTVTITQCKP